MIKPLIWKEWHEQRWKLAFGTMMLLFFTGSLMVSGVTSDKEVVTLVCLLGGMILALYSAMGAFAPEKMNRTTIFLISKPIAAWKIFVCKWFFGWLNFVVPMLVSSFCLRLIDSSWFVSFGKVLFVSIAITTMFYSMTCCFAPRKSSEAFVGFTGLVVILLMSAYTMLTYTMPTYSSLPDKLSPLKQVFFEVVLYLNPFMWVNYINLSGGLRHLSILWIEQGMFLAFIMWIGFRKWQRSA